MSVRWHTYPDPVGAAQACAHHIGVLLEEALSGQDTATLAVSGGTTPKLMFQELARMPVGWKKIHLFWVDERCVPPTDPMSNYLLAEQWLIKPAGIPARNVHRVCGELSPEHASRLYADEIREFFGLGAGELPHFDVVQRGMGADVHTASLFPGEPLIENREDVAAAVFVEKMKQWRVTLLPGVLLEAKHTAMLVTGEDKAEAVRIVFNEPYDPLRYPAQMATHHGRRVAWFLDKPAAARMD